MIVSFHQALEEFWAEGGQPGRGRRYAENCRMLIEGMRKLGFKTLLPDRLQAPIIVTFHMPERCQVRLPELLRRAEGSRLRHLSGQAHGCRQLPHRLHRPARCGSHARRGGGGCRCAGRARHREPEVGRVRPIDRKRSCAMQERVKKPKLPKLPVKAHEKMRIAGKLVDADERIEVRNPYTGAVVGTVPGASPAQVAEAFRIGAAYKSKLTRYDRQKILTNTAEILARRREEIAHLITAEFGPLPQGLALRGRPRLRRLPARRPDGDPRRQRGLLLRHHSARQGAPHLYLAHAGARLHLGHHAVQPSAQHDQPQDRARRSPPTTAWWPSRRS